MSLWPAAIALLALLPPGAALGAQPGQTGFNFLKIGVGARAAAMGEAYVAVAQDPTSLYWNPSGIASAPGLRFHATHNEWIADVRYEYLAAVKGMRGHALGLHAGLLHMGKFETRDADGNPVPENPSFRVYFLTSGLTYGRRLSRSIELGVTAKLLYGRIDNTSATGFAADFGVRYRTPVRGLTLAATATNLGPDLKFIEDPFALPVQARFGVAYRTRRILEGLLVAGDVRVPNDSTVKGHLGGELWVHEMIAVRGGVKLNYDEELGALGFGVKYGDYLFDYAFTPFSDSSELGDTHRISVDWRPGWTERAK